MIGIKHFTRMLEQHLKMKFPEHKISLYVSKRKKQMHMGLDIPLFLFVRHDQLIEEIKKFQMLLYDIENSNFYFRNLLVVPNGNMTIL